MEVMWRKTIKHAFSIFYALIKREFLTNQSARRVLPIYHVDSHIGEVSKKNKDARLGGSQGFVNFYKCVLQGYLPWVICGHHSKTSLEHSISGWSPPNLD